VVLWQYKYWLLLNIENALQVNGILLEVLNYINIYILIKIAAVGNLIDKKAFYYDDDVHNFEDDDGKACKFCWNHLREDLCFSVMYFPW
jgi:hypothetical protein